MKIISGILSYNRFDSTTKLCLDSLLPQIKELKDFKLIVLDNKSTDKSEKKLEDYYKNNLDFTLTLSQENLGFTAGFNKLFKDNEAEWILLIDSDTIFPKDSINNLIKALNLAKEDQQIIGPLTNNAGNSQHIYFETSNFNQVSEELDELIFSGFDSLIEIFRADFFCVAIRSKLWKKLQGLDEKFGIGYYEDFDFCMRAMEYGYKSYLYEKWFVFHQGSASFKHDKNQKKLLKINKNIFKTRHSKIKLYHRRDDVLNLTINIKNKVRENNFINKKRLTYLNNDLPKGFFKRILWIMKLKKHHLNIEN